MLVKDQMTPDPITAHPDTTHKEAVSIFREHNIDHLPIVDKRGRLVGIIVEDDLFAAQPTPATTLSIYEIHSLLSKLQIKEIMRHPVHTVSGNCTLEEAASLMLQHDIGCLPVMENDRVVGIITDTDIFRAFVDLLGGAEEGARFTLRVPDEPGTLAKIAQAVADAGGNIVSVTPWDKGDRAHAFITIKEQGANFEVLRRTLDAMAAEVVDVREKPLCEPKQYG
jgi:acetoin utilization protein AcuB